MTVDQKIRTALLPLGYPVENAVYQGTEKTYFTFQYTTITTDFADDTPGHERYLISVSLVAPLNNSTISKLIRRTKKALFAAGFTWPETFNNSDDDGRNIIFECETAEGVDPYGEDE